MKKLKGYLSKFLVVTFAATVMSFGVQTAKAEIMPGIAVPSFSCLQQNAKFPDPFKFLDGTRMTGKGQWAKRREEISALAQTFGYGVIPGKPQSVKGAFSGNKITVTVTDKGKTVSFDCEIQYPTTGKKPYPAMIGCNANTLNTSEILKLGVACITLPGGTIGAQDGVRAQGKFYEMYGSNHSCGSIGAWVWGASCLIDALETTPEANIDPKHLGVTGGSRNGKGALAIGAFEERIALTIPQESGSGGAGNFRMAEAVGSKVQRVSSLVTEQPWFSTSLNQFSNAVNKLPYDHHEILGMVAPRGLLLIENPDYEWLHTEGCYGNGVTVQMIYDALGVKNNMGFTSVGGHMHCSLPASQYNDVNAFIKKFLLEDSSANTNIFKSDKTFNFDKAKWIDWTVPTLSGALTTTTGTETPTPTIKSEGVKYGDVNGDGVVDSGDYTILRKYILGNITTFPSPNGKIAADLNLDNSIDSGDYTNLRRYLLRIIPSLPIGSTIPNNTPTTTKAPTSGAKGTIKIMPLGDSITDGFTVAGGYRIKLWDCFTKNGIKVDFVGSMSNGPASLGDKDHEGHSGWTISQIDEKVNGWMDTYKPQIVLLHIGTNDMNQKPTGASDRLSSLIDKICAKLPAGGKLYVSNIIPLNMYDVSSYNSTIPVIVQGKASQGKPVYFIEMYKALTTSDLADGVHPNANGYNKMADVWWNAIKADLQ